MKNASYCVSYGKEGRLQQNEQKNSFCYSPFFHAQTNPVIAMDPKVQVLLNGVALSVPAAPRQ